MVNSISNLTSAATTVDQLHMNTHTHTRTRIISILYNVNWRANKPGDRYSTTRQPRRRMRMGMDLVCISPRKIWLLSFVFVFCSVLSNSCRVHTVLMLMPAFLPLMLHGWMGYRGYACDVYPCMCVRLCHIPVIESPGIASQHCAHYEIMHVDLWCSRSLTRKLFCGTFRLNFLLNWKWLEMVWRAYVMMKLYKF